MPRGRSYWYQDVSLYAVAYEDALNLGDPGGLAYEGVVRSRTAADGAVAALRASSPGAADALAAQLATLDLADSTLMTATDANGQLRSAGRREMRAVDALEQEHGIKAGRVQWQADDVDGVTYLERAGWARPGDFVRARITASEDYDFQAAALT